VAAAEELDHDRDWREPGAELVEQDSAIAASDCPFHAKVGGTIF